jgi:nucleotide-binding universal stress UspA family protein
MMDATAAPPVGVGGTGAQTHGAPGIPSSPLWEAPLGEDAPDQAIRYLESFRRRLPGVRGQDIVRTGDPADAILEVALMFNVDLIVMSTHARTGIARWFFGSVSKAVLRRSQLPVLLVRRGIPAPSRDLRRILVPLDGSLESQAILRVVKPLAMRVGAEVVLLHVTGPALARRQAAQSTPSALGDSEQTYRAFAESLAEDDFNPRSMVARGEPARVILEHGRTLDADLIAMSIHARRGFGRAVGPSVARAVLSRADRAVLYQEPVIHAVIRSLRGVGGSD